MTSNWLERNKVIDPKWKVLNQGVDLGEPTSFLDHENLGCTQRQSEISKDIVDNCRTMFESRISAVRAEKLPFPQNLRISSWSHEMEGHAKKCVERCCELTSKTTQQLYKVSTPCVDDHHFKEEEMKYVGEGIKTVNKDNSHSWVRIVRGLSKLVTELIDNEYDDDEQETSTTKTEAFASASRSKAFAKPRRPLEVHPEGDGAVQFWRINDDL